MTLTKLNEKFNSTFATFFGELNSKINKLEPTPDGLFEVPLPTLSNGGATIIDPTSTAAVSLDAPAIVSFQIKKVKPQKVIYRIAFTLEDAAKAAEDDVYFNYVVSPVVKEAVARFQKTFGEYTELRYGESFCTPYNTENGPFFDAGENIELRLSGCWASNKVVTDTPVEATTSTGT